MSEGLPVRGTIHSSSPCTVKDAAAILGSFIQGVTVPEAGLLRSYLEGVSGVLEELSSRPQRKRKEKTSRKHREVDHDNADGEDHEIRSGLNAAEAVNAEAENGYRKGSGKKRKAHGTDGEEENELDAGTKAHSKRKDVGVNAESEEHGVRKKRRKDGGGGGGGGVEGKENSVKRDTHDLELNDGVGSNLENSDSVAEKGSSHKKRRERGPDVETKVSEIREKKRKDRTEH